MCSGLNGFFELSEYFLDFFGIMGYVILGVCYVGLVVF